MTQTVQMTSAIDNSKWELESALARKNIELEDMQRKADTAQAGVKKLEAELTQLQASCRLELDNCKQACDGQVAGKDAKLKDMQAKIDKLQALLVKQVYFVHLFTSPHQSIHPYVDIYKSVGLLTSDEWAEWSPAQ